MEDLSKVREGIMKRQRYLEDVCHDAVFADAAAEDIMGYIDRIVGVSGKYDLDPEFNNYVRIDFEGFEAYIHVDVEYNEEGRIAYKEVLDSSIMFDPLDDNCSGLIDCGGRKVEYLDDEELEEFFGDPRCVYTAEFYMEPFDMVYEPYKK